MMMNHNQNKELQLNDAQALFMYSIFFMLSVSIRVIRWGRGTGKSTILALYISECVKQMPRSTGVMVAQSFAQIKTRTLPSTIQGLEQLGYYKDIHYFVGKKPPKSWKWPEPYEPPLDYSNSMYWYNGAVMAFVSQDGGAASGRGMNVDWVVSDESALLDEEQFNTDVLLTNRGGEEKKAFYPDGSYKLFKDCSLHHSITLATSTPVTAKGNWIFKYEEQAKLHPEKVLFLSANAYVNKKNLGQQYFDNAKAIMPDFLFRAEVLNERMKQVETCFYPKLDENIHCYNKAFDNLYYQQLLSDSEPTCAGDSDLNPLQPLTIGIDWGAHINCLVVAQDRGHELWMLKNIFVKHPRIIDDLIDEFCRYYEQHQNKHIFFFYDPSGNNSQANSTMTYADQVSALLIKKGWTIQPMTYWHKQEQHNIKHMLWNNIMNEDNSDYPNVRFNSNNCRELLISMQNAPAVQGNRASIRKDKSSEKRKGFDQAHATHFSDAADVIVVGMFQNKLGDSFIPEAEIR
jgi:hypothetical protein